MANNTGLDEADVEPGDLRTPSLPKCNRSLVTPPVKFRILKIHAAETRRGKRPPRWEAPDFPRQRPAHCPLTHGNVGGSPTPGNHTAETGLAGWGGRIRTWECSLQEHSSSLLLAPRSSAQSPEVAEIAALLSRRPISRAASMFDTGRSVALSFASAAA